MAEGFRSTRAFARGQLAYLTAFACFAIVFWAVGIGTPLLRLLRGEVVDIVLLDRPYVASRASPGPFLGLSVGFTLFAALFLLPAIIAWRVQARGPVVWDASERGIVRVQAGRTSIVPWRHFTTAMVSRRRGERGDVSVWSTRFGFQGRLGYGGEGPFVWTLSNVLTIVDVEAPDALAARIRERLPPKR